jgi:hypothetical protein
MDKINQITKFIQKHNGVYCLIYKNSNDIIYRLLFRPKYIEIKDNYIISNAFVLLSNNLKYEGCYDNFLFKEKISLSIPINWIENIHYAPHLHCSDWMIEKLVL